MSPLRSALTALHFDIAIPNGWDVRIRGAAAAPAGSVDYPVVHAANFPLPAKREDFGREVVETMAARQVFVALLGYGSESAGKGLFAAAGLPRPLLAEWFDPFEMQRPIAGMAGVQRFFTAQARTFCLYAVVGSFAQRSALVPLVNHYLAGITIQPAATAALGTP